MDSNPYAAPQAELEQADDLQQTFYVVGIRKFSILFIATLGLYSVYWFYANWKKYSVATGANIWPVARAIFNIFFAHALFSKVQDKLDTGGRAFNWSHNALATSYVVLTIASNILDRMAMKELWSPNSDILSLIILAPLFYTVLSAQKAVNVAEGDAEGRSNDTLTWANYVWIVLGLALWALSILGLIVATGLIQI